MSKIIFQVGLLVFLVSIVFFGIQGFDLLETVSRSFLMFIAVMVTAGILLTAVSLFTKGSGRDDAGIPGEQKPAQRGSTGLHRPHDAVAHSTK